MCLTVRFAAESVTWFCFTVNWFLFVAFYLVYLAMCLFLPAVSCFLFVESFMPLLCSTFKKVHEFSRH